MRWLARWHRGLILLAALGGVAALAAAPTAANVAALPPLPTTTCSTLAGGSVTFPGAAHGRVAILIVGFSHASQKPTSAWDKQAELTFGGNPNVLIYPVAVLEGVPGIFRGLVARGIRHSIPPARRDHFLLIYRHEAGWKAALEYRKQGPDDGYIAVLDPEGRVIWRGEWPAKAAPGSLAGSATWREFTKAIAPLFPSR